MQAHWSLDDFILVPDDEIGAAEFGIFLAVLLLFGWLVFVFCLSHTNYGIFLEYCRRLICWE